MLIDGLQLVENSTNVNLVITNVTLAEQAALTNLNVGEIVFVTDSVNPGLQTWNGTAWDAVGAATIAYSEVTGTPDLSLKLDVSQKGAANGVASLDGTGVIFSSQLPSYIDDILMFADQASFPTTGEAGKIYVSEAVNLTYRWTGSAYVEVSSAGGSPVSSGVGFTPVGSISATNVQSALQELDTEKAPLLVSMSTSTTVAATDNGKNINATGAVTIPAVGVLAEGTCFSVYNRSSAAINLTFPTGFTVFKCGTSTAALTAAGSVSLSARGICSFIFITTSEVVLSGNI